MVEHLEVLTALPTWLWPCPHPHKSFNSLLQPVHSNNYFCHTPFRGWLSYLHGYSTMASISTSSSASASTPIPKHRGWGPIWSSVWVLVFLSPLPLGLHPRWHLHLFKRRNILDPKQRLHEFKIFKEYQGQIEKKFPKAFGSIAFCGNRSVTIYTTTILLKVICSTKHRKT